MKLRRIMAFARMDSPLKVVAVYALAGSLWIVGSGVWVAVATGERELGWKIEILKGLLFIATTAAFLHLLVRRLVARHAVIEEDLRVSRQRLALALESANQGLYDLNVQTGTTVVNETYASMLGYDPEDFIETNDFWRERLHPDDRDRVFQVFSDYIEGKLDSYRVEFRQKTASGDWCWVLSLGRLVAWDETGRPLRMLGTHTDITDRKRAEALTADTLAFTQAILHSSPVGIIVYGPDASSVTANEAAAEILGADGPSLLRQNYRDLESWQHYGLLAAADRALATRREVALTGPVVTTFGRSLWLQARFVPFDYGQKQHLLLLLTDQTDQHRNLEQVKLMDTALQAAPVGWLVSDPAGTIQWINPGFTALTGYTADEVVGRNPRILKSGRHSATFYAEMWATIQRGEVWSGEMFNQRKDGRQYQEFMTIAPVRDEGGEIRHFVAIKQDITERRALQQQLARAQRLESIGLLASGIAHDLNNIFAPILLSLELLKLKYPTSDARKTLELIESAGQRGAGIVRQVLTFARGVEGERTEIQTKYLMREAVQILGETLPRNIRIETDVAAGLPMIVGDVTQLNQVLLNLAINARDAMPEGGRLLLGARTVLVEEARAQRNPPLKPGLCVALTVTDSGSGIPDEVLEHMFEPFFTTKPLGKGTGLGLSTVYGIVRSHGGAIEVSTKPGAGSSFTVLLPACKHPAETTVSQPPMPVAFSGAGRRVLVVDDEESIRLVTLQALHRHDFVVEAAADGAEALALFQTDPARFSLVLTDLMMPRMNGRDLARAIHQLAPEVPIIASSGLSEDKDAGPQESLSALGIRALLRKPYTEGELFSVLRQELEEVRLASPKP